jgi:hypothetical protein
MEARRRDAFTDFVFARATQQRKTLCRHRMHKARLSGTSPLLIEVTKGPESPRRRSAKTRVKST